MSESRRTAIYLGWAESETSASVLDLLNDRFDVVFSRHCTWDDAVDQVALAALRADYLFSFGPTILRKPLLESVRVAPINFHTGPPRWPGRGSVSFALLDGDDTFGVTAHVMAEEVDAGPILRVLRFPIEPNDTVASLDRRTKEAIPPLVRALLDALDSSGPMPSGDRWERPAMTMNDLRRLMKVEDGDDDEMVRRKIRAFAHPTKPGPFLERAGYEFWHSGEA